MLGKKSRKNNKNVCSVNLYKNIIHEVVLLGGEFCNLFVKRVNKIAGTICSHKISTMSALLSNVFTLLQCNILYCFRLVKDDKQLIFGWKGPCFLSPHQQRVSKMALPMILPNPWILRSTVFLSKYIQPKLECHTSRGVTFCRLRKVDFC